MSAFLVDELRASECVHRARLHVHVQTHLLEVAHLDGHPEVVVIHDFQGAARADERELCEGCRRLFSLRAGKIAGGNPKDKDQHEDRL